MTDEELSPHARAAETKRRRTRGKLIHAADNVLRDDGLGATVEAIAEDAGVSTQTFYTFYTSRNALCMDAFTELVVAVMEQTVTPAQPFNERMVALANLTGDRMHLARAALIGRLEQYKPGPYEDDGSPKLADFVQRLAWLLWEHRDPKAFNMPRSVYITMHATALQVLDMIAHGEPIETLDTGYATHKPTNTVSIFGLLDHEVESIELQALGNIARSLIYG